MFLNYVPRQWSRQNAYKVAADMELYYRLRSVDQATNKLWLNIKDTDLAKGHKNQHIILGGFYMFKLLEKIIGSYSDRELKRINPIVDKIENLETQMEGLDDEQLKAKTPEFKKRIREGESLDDILPEAFAVVREASKRVLGMKNFRVQLIGGIVLHQGRIAEMKTGEGKTLVATLPVYLNALEGKGVHVVTVYDYLA